jgi:hypothetical protein
MISEVMEIQNGMEMLSADGARIGTVRESWPRTKAYDHVARSMMEVENYGAVAGT